MSFCSVRRATVSSFGSFFMRDWIKIWNKYSFVIFMLHFCFVLCDLNLNLSRVSV